MKFKSAVFFIVLCLLPISEVFGQTACRWEKTLQVYDKDNSGASVLNVKFADARRGSVIGYDKTKKVTLFQTADGGGKWTKKKLPLDLLLGVQFFDDSHWLITGRKSRKVFLLETKDGGISWKSEPSASAAAQGIGLSSVQFVNRQIGWAIGTEIAPIAVADELLAKTIDGGKTWQRQMMGSAANTFSGIGIVDENVVTVGGENALAKTSDGGKTWKRTFFNDDASSLDKWNVKFVSRTEGWAIGQRNLLLHTTDGGETWKNIFPAVEKQISTKADNSVFLRAIEFVTPRKGWIGDFDGALIYTEDGGTTWQTEKTSLPSIREIKATGDYLFAVDYAGLISKRNLKGCR